VSLLITGENGTGKSLLANLIHRRSARRDRPFIEVNMGSVSEHLFESELFGHVRGAFTDAREGRLGRFELADTGTLFLDEIGNTPMTQQPKLLRVLEQGAFEKVGSSRTQSADVRLISASNADLDAAVEAGRFRTDLLYRINTLQLELPPLRDRQEDIKPLAEHFFTLAVRRYASGSSGVSGSAMSRLRRYRWPGNVRELQHVIERAVLLSGDGLIESTHLGLPPDDTDGEGHGEAADRTLADIEKAAIVDRLERFDGNGLEAARSLGLSRSAFYRRREKYGV
jgi:DNA-binding NtrC family response regulator